MALSKNARFCSDRCREGAKPKEKKTQTSSKSWDASQDNQKKRYHKPMITIQSEWTLDQIKATLDAHELGNFLDSAKLWQYIQRDDRLKAVLNVNVSALPALPIMVSSATRDPSPLEMAIAKDLEDSVFDMLPEKTLRALDRQAVGMGFGLAQIEWKVDCDSGRWYPHLHPWPSEAVRYDDPTGSWKVLTREGVELDVTLGDGRWFLWLPDGERSFQVANLLALAFLCFITLNDWSDWIEANDAFGHPTRKATVPRAATQTSKDTFVENLQALDRVVNTILCEKNTDGSGFDFEYVVADMKGVDSIERSLEQANKGKAILINGQSLTTDVSSTGSLSMGAVHKEIKAQVITSKAASFSTDYRDQVLKPYAFYNYGSAKLAPWVEWDTRPPKDQKTEAETHVASAQAITALEAILASTPKELDRLAYLENLELPLKDRVITPQTNPEGAPSPNDLRVQMSNKYNSKGLLVAWKRRQ